jgi:DNA-binding SARP family transcriptional activator
VSRSSPAGVAARRSPRATPGPAGVGDHGVMPETAASGLRLRLHGQAAVVLPDGRIVALERRAAALLALAALEPGIGRLRVATMLWPDSNDPRRNLRQQLLRFRQMFGRELLAGADALSLAPGTLFEAPAEMAAGAGVLLAALDYADLDELDAWLSARRSAEREQRGRAFAQAIAQAEAEQRLADAIASAQQQLAAEPSAEAHHRTLIRLHYLDQDTARARSAFQALRQMLEAELGASPSAETMALMRLVDERGSQALAPARVWATALQRPPRMVGRARELQALQQAVADRRALLLLGEAGMGKSRLLAEGLEGSAAQVLVKAQAGDAGVPYATLARLLRRLLEQRRVSPEPGALARLLPEIGSVGPVAAVPLPADGERLMLQAAVERVLLQAGLQAVAVDDLHFADDASLEMLTALAGSDALAHIAWVFTQRPGEGSAAAAALRDVLEEAQRLEAVDVAPLDAAQMGELVQSLNLPEIDAPAIGERLLRHTGGNPLFALETLKQMLLPGAGGKLLPAPASVGTLIDRRLKQLSDGALALARVAAIAGPDFSPALAQEVLGRRAIDLADAWTELEQAQVLRERAFAHDLVLEATLRSVPKAIAQHLHEAMAQHLEGRHGEPARLAGHWLAAGDEGRALPWLIKAADQASESLRRREEAEFIERAARIASRLPDPALPSAHALWLRVFEALEVADGSTLALPALDQALLHAGDERERLQVLTKQFAAQVKVAELPVAVANGREALRLALRLGDDSLVAQMLTPLAVALSTHGENTEAEALLRAHWPAVERLGEPDPSNYTEYGIVLDNMERPLEARGFHRRATELASRLGWHSEYVITSGNLAVSFIDTGELEEAQHVLEGAERVRLSHDSMRAVNSTGWNYRVMVWRDLGRYTHALELAAASLPLVEAQAPLRVPLDRLHRAWLWAWIGQWARAQQDLAEDDGYAALPGWVLARALQLRARMALWRGQAVGDALQRAQALLDAGALRPLRDSITIDAALAAGRESAADAAAARERLLALRDLAQRDGYHGVHWAADWACAQLALAAGQPNAARGHALACDQRPPGHTPQDCAPGLWWHGLWRVWQRLGERDRAEAARAEGVAWIHRTMQHELPSEFHASFRQAVPAHRELLAG